MTGRGGPPVPSPVIQTQGPSQGQLSRSTLSRGTVSGFIGCSSLPAQVSKRDGPGLANWGRKAGCRCTEQALGTRPIQTREPSQG
jgi:hypothetical protein